MFVFVGFFAIADIFWVGIYSFFSVYHAVSNQNVYKVPMPSSSGLDNFEYQKKYVLSDKRYI